MSQGNNKLVDHLVKTGVLLHPPYIRAFKKIDRANFVPEALYHQAYLDIPLPIGYNQTISQPTTVAIMLELLVPKPDQQILDIGSGSGWTTALLAYIVGKNGQVAGLEIVPRLLEFGQQNLAKYTLPQAKIQLAKPKTLGLPEQKFDRILVSAASTNLPTELITQLKPNGIMVLPVKNDLVKIVRHGSSYRRSNITGFTFVPLITNHL